MRALGIDYGERRIGLALSDATGLLASPWKTIANDANVGAASQRLVVEINALLAESDGLSAVVIGLPRRLSGEANDQTARVRKLVELLRAEVSLPIELQDERLTSHAADEILAGRERDWRKRKQQLDAMAAAIILQDYLDHRDQGPGTRDRGPGTRDRGPETRDQGPGTRDQGPGTGDQGPGTREQGPESDS